jgi:hypothetical protein
MQLAFIQVHERGNGWHRVVAGDAFVAHAADRRVVVRRFLTTFLRHFSTRIPVFKIIPHSVKPGTRSI